MAKDKIIMHGIKKSFGHKHVLTDLSINVKEGESLVIIGGSGTGKSVTLKCLLGLLNPDAGSIKIGGTEMVGANEKTKDAVKRKTGMLFQGAALFDSMKVWENVAFIPLAEKMDKKKAYKLAVQKLAQVGLKAEVADMYPADLSGGMKKRVGLARAIAHTPEIILFDEPTTGLDPISADLINDLIVACTKQLGATTITITHDMASARKIGDKIAMLYEGKIIWTGDAKKIDSSGNKYVEQFIKGSAKGPIKVEV